MESAEFEKLRRKREHLSEWIAGTESNRSLPYVQMHLEVTEWEERALSNRPDEANEIPFSGLIDTLERDYYYLTQALP